MKVNPMRLGKIYVDMAELEARLAPLAKQNAVMHRFHAAVRDCNAQLRNALNLSPGVASKIDALSM
jgi:hypothetical protein